MAGADRGPDGGVTNSPLGPWPDEYEFAAGVRQSARLDPDADPVGGDGDPGREPVEIVSHLAKAERGARADIGAVVAGRPVRLELALFRLLGGLLPRFLVDWVADLGPAGDRLRNFLDSFLHRPLSLLFALGEGLCPGTGYERPGRAADWWRDDPHIQAVLRGSGAWALPDDLGGRLVGEIAPLGGYAGSVTALEQAVDAHFDFDRMAEVVTLQGSWRHGPRPADGAVEDSRSAFTVRLGPLPASAYRRFVPPAGAGRADLVRRREAWERGAAGATDLGIDLPDLVALVRCFAGPGDFGVELLLEPGAESPVGLSERVYLPAVPAPTAGGPGRGRIARADCRRLAGGGEGPDDGA